MKKQAIISIFAIITLIILGFLIGCILINDKTSIDENTSISIEEPETYAFLLTVKNNATDVLYEVNIDTKKHDAHIADVNYILSNSRYYRFKASERIIKYYTFDCTYNDKGECHPTWYEYPINFNTLEEIEEKDTTYIYKEIKELIEKIKIPEGEEKTLSSSDFIEILNKINYLDDSLDLSGMDNYHFSFSMNNQYIEEVNMISGPTSYIRIKFKNYNKFKTTTDLYIFDSR